MSSVRIHICCVSSWSSACSAHCQVYGWPCICLEGGRQTKLKIFVHVLLGDSVHMSLHGLVFVTMYLRVSSKPSCSLPACPSHLPPTQEGHSAPLSASNPVCPEEIEGSGRLQHTRGATNTITSLSQTLNGALRLFNKAKRGRRDQFNTRPDSNGKRVNK